MNLKLRDSQKLKVDCEVSALIPAKMRADSESEMNRGINATASGMMASERWMEVTANNLANVGTNGFKRDGVQFTDLYDRQLVSQGGNGKPIGSISSGIAGLSGYTIMQRGVINASGNPLDVAIESEKGLFAVDTGGKTLYTRDGTFGVNSKRELIVPSGAKVLDTSGNPILLPNGQIQIGKNGAIAVDGKKVATIGVWDGTFLKAGANLFTVKGQATVLDSDSAQVRQGATEGSNVNSVDEMMAIINIGRSYELAQKSMTQQDELTQKLIQVLQ